MCWTAAAWFAACVGAAANAAESAAESDVKAVFLHKFPAYVEWPEHVARSPNRVEIGVIGNDAVLVALERLAAARAAGEPVLRVHRVDNVAALKGLQVLFIGNSASAKSKQYVEAAHAESVLTVTERAASEHDSIIDFRLINERVRFTISLPAAQRARVRISSRLLAVAHEVHKEDAR